MSTATSHWSNYMDSSNPSPHTHSDPHASYHSYGSMQSASGNDSGRAADPSIPRRVNQSYHSNSGGDNSPFAYSPTNSSSYGHTYNNSTLPYGGNHNSHSYFGGNNSSYNSASSAASPSTTSNSMNYYSYGQDNSALEYSSTSSSINPAYLGGRAQPTANRSLHSGARDPINVKSEPMDSRLVPEVNSGSQGVLYPARIQYTDNATDKETSWLKRQCHVCGATSPPGWRKSVLKVGKIVCNACGLYEKTHHRPRPTRLSDESRNGVHRRVSTGMTTPVESPSRASFSTSPNLSRAPSDNRVQYASAYNTNPHAQGAGHGGNQGSMSTSPVLQRASNSMSAASGSRSPPN